jgi:serine kinase of HPr protein (carbohydrate metabolism regulator)
MAHAKTGEVLITIQSHKNTIAVAVLASLPAILVCNSRPVPDDMIEAAKDEGIAILRTAETQFAVSGKLYALLQAAT